MTAETLRPFTIGKHRLGYDGELRSEHEVTDGGKTAGHLTPAPEKFPGGLSTLWGGREQLNMLGRCDPITGALKSIEIVVISDRKSCGTIPYHTHKVKQESLAELFVLSPCYIGSDGYIYPSKWVIKGAAEAGQHKLMDYYDWKPGTEPKGAIVDVQLDRARCGVANYTKNLELDEEEELIEGKQYLAWHATLAKHVGNQWIPNAWSAGFFPAGWDHVSLYRFIFSLLPFSFSKGGWFSWACNYTKDSSAILKYRPSKDVRILKGGCWPTETSAQELPVRILDYSAGRALCDTRDITYEGTLMIISGGIELWHVANQEKLADIWPAKVPDMEYDPQGFGIDKGERVISATISNDIVVLLTAQNYNVEIGDMMFVAPDGGWADTTNEGETWAAGLPSYWEAYMAMIHSGTYIWIDQANAKLSGHGQWIYPAGPPGYVNLFCQTGPYQWEFDRRYRIYIYNINDGSLAEVTLPGVNMQVHLRRNGGQIYGTWAISGGPSWKTCYRTWFDAMKTDLTLSSTGDGLYFSGRSGSRTILHPLTDEVIGVQSPEHVCAIINANDTLLYVPLNYVEHTNEVYGEDDPRAGQKIIATNIRLYCFGLTPDANGELPAAGCVTGPYGESVNICYFNYKHVFVEIGA